MKSLLLIAMSFVVIACGGSSGGGGSSSNPGPRQDQYKPAGQPNAITKFQASAEFDAARKFLMDLKPGFTFRKIYKCSATFPDGSNQGVIEQVYTIINVNEQNFQLDYHVTNKVINTDEFCVIDDSDYMQDKSFILKTNLISENDVQNLLDDMQSYFTVENAGKKFLILRKTETEVEPGQYTVTMNFENGINMKMAYPAAFYAETITNIQTVQGEKASISHVIYSKVLPAVNVDDLDIDNSDLNVYYEYSSIGKQLELKNYENRLNRN